MKRLFSLSFFVVGILSIVLYLSTYAVTCYYHDPRDSSAENITCWWLLCIIMDRLGYFALSLSIYLFTYKVREYRELLFNLVSIAACTVSGNDLIERYGGITSFRVFWDSLMMLIGIYSIVKIYKQSCRNL